MTMNRKQFKQKGFTLIELLVVVLLLSIVVGAVFSQIERAQVRYRVEDQRVDLTQQEREFIDQFTRDLHQVGYPAQTMFGTGVAANNFAVGLISFSDTDVVMEGDVDGDGVVETVEYSYDAPSQSIRRSSLPKGSPGPATKYIEVQNVTGTSFFKAYDGTGAVMSLPIANLKQIKSMQITLTTQGVTKDNDSHQDIQVTMTGMARLVNN